MEEQEVKITWRNMEYLFRVHAPEEKTLYFSRWSSFHRRMGKICKNFEWERQILCYSNRFLLEVIEQGIRFSTLWKIHRVKHLSALFQRIFDIWKSFLYLKKRNYSKQKENFKQTQWIHKGRGVPEVCFNKGYRLASLLFWNNNSKGCCWKTWDKENRQVKKSCFVLSF